MSDLIILFGNKDYCPPKSSGFTYAYSIGTGLVRGAQAVAVNDSQRLRTIALETRDEYSRWVYSLNDIYLRRNLTYRGLSLFLVSDCSCKRTELFDTYNSICNLLLLQEIMSEISPKQIITVGADRNFFEGLVSISQSVPIKRVNEPIIGNKFFRRIGSDLRYTTEVALVVMISSIFAKRQNLKDKQARRYCFSIYPKMISKDGQDKKYGKFVKSNDRHAVSIITDGLHQHVSVLSYFRERAKAKKYNFVLMDEYLRSKDWIRGLYWIFRLRYVFLTERAGHEFRSINISGWIKEELAQSASRQARFMIILGAYERFFKNIAISEFVYYLHEYPLGRMMSWLLHSQQRKISTCGFQHGPAAWRKLLYFMGPDESKTNGDYLTHVPIPQKVIAEDRQSALIYRHAGYRNIQVMEKIYRLSYLEDIEPKREIGTALIAPGLHDGEGMLEIMVDIIQSENNIKYFLKPHPLAHNLYVSKYQTLPNLVITTDAIEDLLARVAIVYVTYSSVGQEAMALGIPVSVVEIPGFVNESPLADLESYDSMLTSNSSVDV